MECSGLFPPIIVPGELSSDDAIQLEDLYINHDPISDTLFFSDYQENVHSIAYLGITPKHLLPGYLRLVATISDPWINGSFMADFTPLIESEFSSANGNEIIAYPRIERNGMVIRRASWVLPVTLLPSLNSSDVDLVLSACMLREKYGLPEEVFVSQLSRKNDTLSFPNKPIWVSLLSALSIRSGLRTISTQTSYIRIVEALPSRSQYIQHDKFGEPIVSEYVKLFHWNT